jgi:hypothetical protein
MKNTYIKTLETLKGKCNLVTNSESLSDLKDSDNFWTDAMLSMLENMKKEQVTVEEGIAYLENIIQKSGSNYKN